MESDRTLNALDRDTVVTEINPFLAGPQSEPECLC